MCLTDDYEVMVDRNIFDQFFFCELTRCKGMCCVKGDAGASLKEREIYDIEAALPAVKKYLPPHSVEFIQQQDIYVKDEGEYVTPCIDGNKECVYAFFENGIARCAFEKAFFNGETTFRKPISCHLYPIKKHIVGNKIYLSYHRWGICHCAEKSGTTKKITVFEFCKDALIREFGEDWYYSVSKHSF